MDINSVKHNNRLTLEQLQFFETLIDNIDVPIYFYGSIQRLDFIFGKSDIDVDIFTENETSTIQVLCNYLNIKRTSCVKFAFKINSNMIYGYKIKYINSDKNINAEFSIYNMKYKNIILNDRNRHIPLYIVAILYLIKTMYYKLNLISKHTYKRCKRFLMNPGDELKFIEVDN